MTRLNEDTDVSWWDRVIMDPLVTGCQRLSRIGGLFSAYCNFVDGQKFVCLDDFSPKNVSIRQKLDDQDPNVSIIYEHQCLVYSFGVGDDITFETGMAKLNCTVYAHDPTVALLPVLHSRVHFKPIGLKGNNDTDQLGFVHSSHDLSKFY